MKAGGWYNRKLQEKIKNFLAEYPKLLQIEASEIFSYLSSNGHRSELMCPYAYTIRRTSNNNRLLLDDLREFKRRNGKILHHMTVQDVQAALDYISVTKIMES